MHLNKLPHQLTQEPSRSVSLIDETPFFERSLLYGVRHHIINAEKIAAISNEAPKGIVQIARYFGSEFLRPDLEKGLSRLINLVSFSLEDKSGGDVHSAAILLRDFTLLSHSKFGSNMVQTMLTLPSTTYFTNDSNATGELRRNEFAAWSTDSFVSYKTELSRRKRNEKLVRAGLWTASNFSFEVKRLADKANAESVIRAGILAASTGLHEMPDARSMRTILLRIRHLPNDKISCLLRAPDGMPPEHESTLAFIEQSVLDDLPWLRDKSSSVESLMCQSIALMSRYFWAQDA